MPVDHHNRLNRDLTGSFGEKYAFEELIAEIALAFCCASLGIAPPSVMPTISAPGWTCCARTIAPSSARPRRQARLPIGCWLRTGHTNLGMTDDEREAA